ncbi:hypothetical protein DSO57_1023004 [Entomophthora muscae]|uniref:Uncharacterized protein n=1 Tax=Entomophthora muscae TaxID=34485 RepID=A0ACC2SSG8_9FUNG|nr:hypothetical protein DSO57_1023004 [Entomophthora muscae]
MPTALPGMARDALEQNYAGIPKQDNLNLFGYPNQPQRDFNLVSNPNTTNRPITFSSVDSTSNSMLNSHHSQASQFNSRNLSFQASESQLSLARRMSADQGYSHPSIMLSNQRFGESASDSVYSRQMQENMSGLAQVPGMSKAKLVFEGDIQEIPNNWSEEERSNRRRLVQFYRKHDNNSIMCRFSIVPPSSRPPNSIVISCIYWEERDQFFITSVDCIHLLESLISVRFTVEEKNRIRRNLEGFRPLTVSKCKQDTAEFFKLIMAFPNPKPRNIEKDVKVFPWSVLQHALIKIVSKYATGFSSSIPKYDAPSYPVAAYNHQVAGFQRRYSQPSNLDMYNQPYFAPPMAQMPAIPERPPVDQFPRRHSMSDPYSVQRLHQRAPPTSLSRVEEDCTTPYSYSNQPTGLGIAEGYGTSTGVSSQSAYQSTQQSNHQNPGFFFPTRE